MITGQTVRDLVSGNWCRIVEIDAIGGRVHLENPYIKIGWRLISEIEEYKTGPQTPTEETTA